MVGDLKNSAKKVSFASVDYVIVELVEVLMELVALQWLLSLVLVTKVILLM